MPVDFDKVIDRKGTESTKWDRLRMQYQDEDLLPLWLADMDFPVSDAIREALIRRASHPVYGYTDRGRQYYRLFADRFRERHGFDVEEEDVILSTGVMYSVTAALNLFTAEGDGIMIFRPCYHPFVDAVENTGRIPVYVDMKDQEDRVVPDMEAAERYASRCRALLLCNPHNPTGRIFDEEELQAISDLCERHQLLIISDEIHNDFIYPGHQFSSIMMASSYAKENTICCVAPTKAFNLAGIKISAVFIKNTKMRERFRKYAAVIGISSINLFAMEAVKAAYLRSQEWQEKLLDYLKENRAIVTQFVKDRQWVQGCEPEGTYFYWLRFSGVPDIYERLIKEAHVALNRGTDFHPDAEEYVRLNFACPKKILNEALLRIDRMMQERRTI